MQNKINFFADHNFTVLMEVPEVTGFDSNTTGRDAQTPFRTRVHCQSSPLIWEKFSSELSVILVKCLCVIKDAHNICRSKASEILLFMLSDSDRMKLLNDDTYTHVIGYGMKGYSLQVNVLRQMVELLRNILKDYNIPVLCESFDGHWANLAFKDINRQLLTFYHLLAKSWEEARNLSRRGLMLKLKTISSIETVDLVKVSQNLALGDDSACSGNLAAEIVNMNDGQHYISISSKGGHLKEDILLCHASLRKVKNINENWIQVHEADLKIKNKITGIHHDDMDIVFTFDPTLVKDIISDIENNESCAGIQLEDFLNSPRLQVLTKILNELQIHGKSTDWRSYTEDDIFPHILMYKDKLLNFPNHDIDLIVKVIEGNTARKIFCFQRHEKHKGSKNIFSFWKWTVNLQHATAGSKFEDYCPKLCRKIPIVNPTISLCRCCPH